MVLFSASTWNLIFAIYVAGPALVGLYDYNLCMKLLLNPALRVFGLTEFPPLTSSDQMVTIQFFAVIAFLYAALHRNSTFNAVSVWSRGLFGVLSLVNAHRNLVSNAWVLIGGIDILFSVLVFLSLPKAQPQKKR